VAVFALGSGTDLASEMVSDEVQSITDAEGGQIELEERGVGIGGVGVVDGRRTAGEDDAEGLVGLDF